MKKRHCFEKGHTPWNKGIKGYEGNFSKGEDRWSWKGDGVSYSGIHKYMNRHYGKATKCDFDPTHISKVYDWANISGRYKRELTDWLHLCRSCHVKFDRKSSRNRQITGI